MGMKWTMEQQKVIDARNKNLLVSAAAGSGKTAVLVERIISMILDEENPVDIDRLLIVTFTKAAAGEMRERIGAALEARLMDDPENVHLQKQTTLLHRAQISTIHGFCSYVIRNYFHLIDLDPGYRVADEGELKLLRLDVAEEVLEAAYAEDRPEFRAFIESFAAGKTDEGVKDLLINIAEYASSAPWPKEWLTKCLESYQIKTKEDMEQTPWMQYLWEDICTILEEASQMTQENLMIAKSDEGPYFYEDVLKEDRASIDYVAAAKNYDELFERINLLSFNRLPSKKDDNVDPDFREMVKVNRGRIKDMVTKLKEQYFFAHPDKQLEIMNACAPTMEELVRLVNAYMDAFSKKKREKNLLDFSDLEHFALDILVEREDGKLTVTEAAEELSQHFQEILVDEYQDSNLVQEYLISYVSAAIRGEYNVFMVGDVKQSVYRFRQARPELFMDKLETYSKQESSKTQRIDLHKNFRSRKEVLQSVNFFFQQLMRKELGGVEYDKSAALYAGADFPEGNDMMFPMTEVLTLDQYQSAYMDEDDSNSSNARELEARMIGMRIREMVGKELVWDKNKNAYRPMQYRDCVILLRTMSGWAESFGQVLNGLGIPAYSTSKTGYFSANEVQTLLDFLRILDNPRQEIPYAAVLASAFVGCTPTELALLKCIDKEQPIYNCVPLYIDKGEDEKLREKLVSFQSLYDDMVKKEVYTPIHQLIWNLVETSGYGNYVAALPAGEQRIANVRMLVEKAVAYESTSYTGLFHFIRYIEQLNKYDVDFGEVNIVGEQDDTVRIMSIHKSKGLEFPVVFVAGMNKRFNQRDLSGPILLDADFGVASICVDYEKRTKAPSLLWSAVRQKLTRENLGEELRVLYVAMTRAKEKLILTGLMSKVYEKIVSYAYLKVRKEAQLPYSMLVSASNYWAWILPALARVEDRAPIIPRYYTIQDLVEDEAKDVAERTLFLQDLKSWDTSKVYDEKMKEILSERFSFVYPYHNQRDIPVKVSVSELKKQAMGDEEAYEPYHEPDVMPLIPQFMQKEDETVLEGAARGTAYHAFMERIDLTKCDTEASVKQQAKDAKDHHFLTEAEYGSLHMEDFVDFVNSDIGIRMKAAQEKHTLHREQPFVIGVPADTMKERWSADETILVQGIIDAFFYEGENIILVDYKTDRVKQPEELIARYRTQLDYYAEALEKLTQKKATEKIIYSFTLKKVIPVTE